MTPDGPPLHLSRRAWLLSFFDAAERYGLSPLSLAIAHRLVFLANVMAPVYELPVPDGYLLKYRRGPYFPAVAWDLGRLVAQGMLAVNGVKPLNDQDGFWFDANYRITDRGIAVCRAVSSIPSLYARQVYFREFCRAYAALGTTEDRADLAEGDVNYAPISEGLAVDFSTADKNYSPHAADILIPEDHLTATRRERLQRYLHYLDQVRQSDAKVSHVG